MPFYEDESLKTCLVDFGNGRSLTIKLKEDFGSMPVARRFLAHSKRAAAAQKNIERLEKKQESVESVEQFNEIQKEIETWEAVPDNLQLLIEFIFSCGKGWDRYANKEAETRGEEVPFTKENIGTLPINVLNKISNALLKQTGLLEETDPKDSLTTSPQPSTPKDTETSNFPTGRLN